MPTQGQIQQLILSAQLQMADMASANRLLLIGGARKSDIDWTDPIWYYLNIKGLQKRYNLGDYTSSDTLAIYDCLSKKVGTDTTVNTIDPNFQLPGSTTVTVATVVGFNTGTIPFTTTGPFILNYSGYAALYGNNPSIQIYTIQGGIEQEDEQTAPIIARTGSGTSAPISTITLDYPPFTTTTGYILISGFVPTSAGGSPGSGGSGAITFNYTDANLLQDGGGSWYLPLTLPAGLIPFVVLSNGQQVTGLFDDTFTPNRLYGFANNDSQTILVKAI